MCLIYQEEVLQQISQSLSFSWQEEELSQKVSVLE